MERLGDLLKRSFFAFVAISFFCSGSSPPPSAASTLAPPSPSRGRPGNRRSKGFLCHPSLPSLVESRWASLLMKFPYAFSYSVQIYSFVPSPLALSFPAGKRKRWRRASRRNFFCNTGFLSWDYPSCFGTTKMTALA